MFQILSSLEQEIRIIGVARERIEVLQLKCRSRKPEKLANLP